MPKLAWISLLAALATVPASAETAIPDLRGTWTGESESIVLGRGNPHHAGKRSAEPRHGTESRLTNDIGRCGNGSSRLRFIPEGLASRVFSGSPGVIEAWLGREWPNKSAFEPSALT
jgi:hypothetical protein